MEFYQKYKSIIKTILAFLLFFFSSLIILIPTSIFSIDLNTCSDLVYYSLRLFANLFMAAMLFLLFKKDIIKDFKDFIHNFGSISDIAIKYWVIGLIVMALSNQLIATFTPVKVAANEEGVQAIISSVPIISFVMTTFIAPFCEELIFRKSIRESIKSKIVFILVSGFVFGALHVITSVTSLYDYLYIIPYSALGIAFAKIYVDTDNIFGSIFVHFLHNGILTLLSILGTGMILW